MIVFPIIRRKLYFLWFSPKLGGDVTNSERSTSPCASPPMLTDFMAAPLALLAHHAAPCLLRPVRPSKRLYGELIGQSRLSARCLLGQTGSRKFRLKRKTSVRGNMLSWLVDFSAYIGWSLIGGDSSWFWVFDDHSYVGQQALTLVLS